MSPLEFIGLISLVTLVLTLLLIAMGAINIQVDNTMPWVSSEDRSWLVGELRSMARDARYSEPEVGIFGSDSLGNYLDRLAKDIEEQRL